MVTRLLEQRPETVWALMRDLPSVPTWLDPVSGAPVPGGGGRPAWPLTGAQLTYRVGRGERRRTVTVDVLICEPRQRLTLAMTRPLLGSDGLGRAFHGRALLDIGLQPGPVLCTVMTVTSSRFGFRRLLPGATRSVTDRTARRIVTGLMTQLSLRGPAMATLTDRTPEATATRRPSVSGSGPRHGVRGGGCGPLRRVASPESR